LRVRCSIKTLRLHRYCDTRNVVVYCDMRNGTALAFIAHALIVRIFQVCRVGRTTGAVVPTL
jgi:hypothetical protein